MTVQTINIGNVVNDGLGDDLRSAFEKVNANFQSLDSPLTIRAINIGSTGQGIFAQKVDNELQFKNLVGGNRITLDGTSTSIVINSTQPEAFSTIFTSDDSTSISSSIYSDITLKGAGGIEVTSSESTITFGISIPAIASFTLYDFGSFDGFYTSSNSFLLAASNVDFGTIATPGSLKLNLGNIA